MTKTIYSPDYKFLTKQLREARLKYGLTQKETAEKLHKPQSYISKIETGERRVDVTELMKFAELYQKDISYFIPPSEKEPSKRKSSQDISRTFSQSSE